MSEIYQGPSDGFAELTDGYVDYSEEIIVKRAVPDLRDGQKMVTRRILYAMFLNKKDYLEKSATMVGEAMKYHPHGDSSVYGSMTLMTDENGSYNVPPLIGMGSMGKASLSEKPAHMRYTKVMLQPYTITDYFQDKEVMNLIDSEEGILKEPEVLNVSYPVVLVNGASGIAVAAGTKMASFNFRDVLELTIKYLVAGELTVDDMIFPDFPTGGVIVCNKEEVARMMLTGKGKIKIRAKVDIEGADIIVREVPFGRTAEYIVEKINNSGIKDVRSAKVSVDRTMKYGYVTVSCKNKRVVPEVLMRLYQKNLLQNVFSSNILVVNGDKPEILGVYGIIEKWCAWREEVINKKVDLAISNIKENIKLFAPLIKLVEDVEKKDAFVYTMTHEGKAKAVQFLLENMEGLDLETAKWVADRNISVYHTGGTYAKQYEDALADLKEWEDIKKDVKKYIVRQLEDLLAKRGNNYPRKSELSFKDYKFSKISDSDEVVDDSACVYTLRKDGFLLKTRNPIEGSDILTNIYAQANSILIGFDNYGRILRVIGSEIPYTATGAEGTYLPKYFGAENEVEEFGYKILYMCLLDGTKKMLVYRDGYIGYFDTSEYVGKKNIKVVAQGVCTAVRDKLLEIYEEADIPDYILLADDSNNKIKLGVVVTDTIPERSRTSRAKVLSGSDINTKYLKGFNGFDLVKFVGDVQDHIGKFKVFKGTWYGDPGEVEDGFYLDMCKDLVEE